MKRYKTQFGRELNPDLIKIYSLFPLMDKLSKEKKESEKMSDEEKVSIAQTMLGIETEWMYDIAFIMAQQADPSIVDELEWLDSFDDIDIFGVFVKLMPMLRMEQQVAPKNE